MANVGYATMQIIPSMKGVGASLTQGITGPAGTAGAAGGVEAGKKFGSSMVSRAKSFIGPLAALAAGAAVIGFGKDAFAEAQEAQKIGALTAAVIESTGGAANVTAGQVGDLSAAISNKIGVDDEAVQSGANMLLTFKNIRNEVGDGNDIFDQSTVLLADMSAAMGTDMKTGAVQLGKALNDPIAGVSALSRVGVQFTDEQKDTIAALVETGDVMGAQKVILGELEGQFGGAAEAMATPADKAKVSWDNFKELLGTAALPVIDKVFEAFSAGLVIVTDFAGWLSEHLGPAVEDVTGWMSDNESVVKTVGVALAAAATAIGVIVGVTKAWSIAQGILNVVLAANPIALLVIGLAALVTGLVFAYQNSETFRDIVDAAMRAVGETWQWLYDSVISPVAGFIMGAWDAVKDGALNLASVAVGGFRSLLDFFLGMVEALVTGAAKAFGWVPGIGPQLKEAADAVAGFRDDANASLAGIERELDIMANGDPAREELANLREYYANNPLLVGIRVSGVQGMGGILEGTGYSRVAGRVPALAEGGYVPATPGGVLALIAEGGRGEIVAPEAKIEAAVERALSRTRGGDGIALHVDAREYNTLPREASVDKVRAITKATRLGLPALMRQRIVVVPAEG